MDLTLAKVVKKPTSRTGATFGEGNAPPSPPPSGAPQNSKKRLYFAPVNPYKALSI